MFDASLICVAKYPHSEGYNSGDIYTVDNYSPTHLGVCPNQLQPHPSWVMSIIFG